MVSGVSTMSIIKARYLKGICSLLLTIGLLTACGDANSEDNDVNNDATEVNSDNSENESEESNKTEEASDVIDDEYIKATFGKPEHRSGEFYDSYDVEVEIENKTDDTIIVNAFDAFVDGTELAGAGIGAEIKGKEKRTSMMKATNEEGELPEEFETIEFGVSIVDYDTFRILAEHKVKISN